MTACSPCVVGMLWEVTDYDTDIMSTDLISKWIPSNSEIHWNQIDKMKWNKGLVGKFYNVYSYNNISYYLFIYFSYGEITEIASERKERFGVRTGVVACD